MPPFEKGEDCAPNWGGSGWRAYVYKETTTEPRIFT